MEREEQEKGIEQEPSFFVYSVREGEMPILRATGDAEEGRELVVYARRISGSRTTAYVFATKLGLPGHSNGLIFACANGWKLSCDEHLVRHISTKEGASHINWRGWRVKSEPFRMNASTWSQADAEDVDFLFTDGGSIDKAGIEGMIERVLSSFGLSSIPGIPDFRANGDGEDFGGMGEELAKNLRITCARLIKALPDEAVFDLERVENPATQFAKEVRSGRWDSLSNEEYDAMYDRAAMLSKLWQNKPVCSISEIAWRALALESVGIQVDELCSVLEAVDANLD